MHAKLIYEDKQYHNAVFVGLDENGIARHAHKRGTYTQGEPYKGNTEGSDPRYSFHWIGKSDRLYVFEAPVDMLSFITLHPKDWMNHSYVTLDGVSEHAMEFLAELWGFLRVRKKFWLLPIILVLLLFGVLVVLTSGTAVAPFIYTLF